MGWLKKRFKTDFNFKKWDKAGIMPGKPKPKGAGPEELEALRQAKESWAHYRDTYRPLEDAQINEIQKLRGNTAQTDLTARSVSRARQNLPTMTAPEGAGGGDARSRALALESIHGGAIGATAVQSIQAGEDRYQQGMQRIIDYGLNKNARAIQGTAEAASLESARLGTENALSNFQRDNAWSRRMETYGAVGGQSLALGQQWLDRRRQAGAPAAYGNSGASTTFDPSLAANPQRKPIWRNS